MGDFLLSFLFNLIFRYELLIMAVLAWLGHIYLDLPVFIVYVLLGLWIVVSLLITLGLGVLTRGTPPQPFQKNINPYSKKTKDFICDEESNTKR